MRRRWLAVLSLALFAGSASAAEPGAGWYAAADAYPAGPGGSAVVLPASYPAYGGFGSTVLVTTGSAGGFGVPQQVVPSGQSARGAVAAGSDSGHAFVVWEDTQFVGGKSDAEHSAGIYASARMPGGPFGPPLVISEKFTPWDRVGPRVVMADSGEAVVAWQAGHRVAYVRWRPGVGLGPQRRLPWNMTLQDMAIDSAGTVVFAGAKGKDFREARDLVATLPGSGTPPTAVTFDPNPREVFVNVAVAPDGRTLVTWQSETTGELMAAYRPARATAFGPARSFGLTSLPGVRAMAGFHDSTGSVVVPGTDTVAVITLDADGQPVAVRGVPEPPQNGGGLADVAFSRAGDVALSFADANATIVYLPVGTPTATYTPSEAGVARGLYMDGRDATYARIAKPLEGPVLLERIGPDGSRTSTQVAETAQPPPLPAPPPRPRVFLAGKRAVRPDSRGRVRIRVRCAGGQWERCIRTFVLGISGHRDPRVLPQVVRPNRPATLVFHLPAKTRRELRNLGPQQVELEGADGSDPNHRAAKLVLLPAGS